MKRVNYDDRLYRNYARGRALTEAHYAVWARAFARRLPPERPLAGVDVGSGTGRFTPLLATEFGGPVTGVEPSDRMREVAAELSAYPRVRYEKGRAEAIPLTDASADFALLFLVWHHVPDRPAAARELLRVVRPGGIVLLRTSFRDRLPQLWWLDAFPRGREIEAALYEPLQVVLSTFTTAGWEFVALDEIEEPSPGSRVDQLARLKIRSLSLFEHFTSDEIASGFAELERRVAADPEAAIPPASSDLVVFRRPTGPL